MEVCPVQVLSLERNEIMEKDGCIRCYQCERYCPDIAIEVSAEEMITHEMMAHEMTKG